MMCMHLTSFFNFDMDNPSQTAIIAGLNIDMVATTVATILSTIVSSVVAFVTARYSVRHQKRQNLEDLITKLIEFSLEYPYLEDDNYCAAWAGKINGDEESIRYENYCCVVFNLIERVWEFCRGNQKKMDKILYVEELVIRHYRWWIFDSANSSAYNKRFQKYIKSFER